MNNDEATTPEFIDVDDGDDEASTLSPLAKRVHAMGRRVKEQPPRDEKADQADMQQLDLFVANLLDYNLKGDMATMEAPLFSLSTKPDMETWKWKSPDGKKWIEVTPSAIGRATMHDKDLLIYLSSQLVAAMNDAARKGTKMPGRRIRFTLHDYLVATGRDTAGKSYEDVEKTLDRLAGTRLKTNIEMGNMDSRSNFGMIEKSDYILIKDAKGNRRMFSIEVTLSQWLYRALELRNILTLNPGYFNLRKPLEKRLYELARKHVGDQPEWIISEENLYAKSGSKATKPEFRRMLKTIIADDSILDYRLSRQESDKGENQVRFYQKDAKKLALAYANKTKGQGRKKANPGKLAAEIGPGEQEHDLLG